MHKKIGVILFHFLILFYAANGWAAELVSDASATQDDVHIDAETIGMVTASSTGTYIKFGHTIAEVSKKYGVDIFVKESQGSVDNIERMASRENAGFGIVQSDVMLFLQKSKDLKLVDVAKKLRVLFPLYKEEVHVLARREIKTLDDLRGKRINVGQKKSGTWLTAVNIFAIEGIRPQALLDYKAEQALDKLLAGEIDAMFYVVGKPIDALSERKDMGTLHFVPINQEKILKRYDTSSLNSAEYPWLGANVSVPTIGVKALLVSFDFFGNTNDYYTMRCNQIAKIGQGITSELAGLKQGQFNAHPKWQQVDLNAQVIDWKRDRCVGMIPKAPRKPEKPQQNNGGGIREGLMKCVLEGGEC